MIYLSKFSLNSITVKLKTLYAIDKDEEKEIKAFLETLYRDINHNIEGSAAYKFNSFKINEHSEYPPHFVDFLEINKKLSLGYNTLFNPFLPLEKNTVVEEVIDFQDNKLTKKDNIVIDTSYLRKPYLVEGFGNYLDSNFEWENYLIEADNIYLAKGKKEWVINPESIPGTYGISDEALLIDDYYVEPRKKNDIKAIKIIISSVSPCINKVEQLILPEMFNVEEYRQYSERNNLKFLVLDSKHNYYQVP